MRKQDEKRTAEQLEKYIQQDAAYAGELDKATERIVDTLHQAASDTRPRPGFINELANQLREQETKMSEQPKRTFRGIVTRLLLGGAAVAAMALLAFYLVGVFGAPPIEPAVSEDGLPARPVLEAEGGQHFPDAEFEVMVPLDDEGGEMSLYSAQQLPLPATLAEARALAQRFGLEDPTVYETPSEPSRWIVMDAEGRNISFRTEYAALEGFYYSLGSLRPVAGEGEPPADAEAQAAAVAFLEEAGMLPDSYKVEFKPTGSPLRMVQILPLIDGHPLGGNMPPIEVGVGPDGTVVHARINPLELEPTGESVPVKPAEEAFNELVEGTARAMGYSYETATSATGNPPRYFTPPPPEHEAGEEVTLLGTLTVLLPVEGGEPWAILHPPTGVSYYLQGAMVADLVESPPQSALRVTGTIERKLRPQEWILNVGEVEPQMGMPVECKTGRIRYDGDVYLEADEGERYPLAYPPEALASGVRAEVCASNYDGEQAVQWLHIASPPASELATGGGGGGGGSVSVAVEQVEDVQVERVVGEEGVTDAEAEQASARPTPSEAVSGSSRGGGGEGSGGGVDARPAEEDSPYQVGELAEVTGIVEGVIYVEEGVRTYEITLRHEEVIDGNNRFFVYPLLGEPDLLEELAAENRLHVQVTAQVVPAPEGRSGTHNQALVVEAFERVYPDEAMVTLLGQVEQTTINGEAVTVFVDDESGEQYALDNTHLTEDRRVWIAGVVHPTQTVGDLPLLRLYSSRTGNDVDQAETPDDVDFELGMPVVDKAEMSSGGLRGTLIVEQAVLGYKYDMGRPSPPVPAGEEPVGVNEPVYLQPTWFFYGHIADSDTTFTIEVPATVESGGGRQ